MKLNTKFPLDIFSRKFDYSKFDLFYAVEYDASNRALAWLQRKNMVSREELAGAKDALRWAARTYVVAALGSLATLAYFAFQVFGGRRN